MEQIALVVIALVFATAWVGWGWHKMYRDRKKRLTRLPKELSIPEMLRKVNDHPSKNGQHNYHKTGTDA